MSWAEVTKVNSNITEPLNYLMWVQDLAVYGTKGYVYKDVNKLVELSAKSPSAVANDIAVVFLLEGVIQNGFHIGEYFKKIIPNTGSVFDNLNTMTAIANSSTPMVAIENSTVATNALANSSLKQTLSAQNTQSWTTRRPGKVWIIGQKQSWSANTGHTIQLRYTLVGNNTHSNTTPETHNKYAPVNKFFDSITNYNSAGVISCFYEFIPID